jgi:hypothetical protein
VAYLIVGLLAAAEEVGTEIFGTAPEDFAGEAALAAAVEVRIPRPVRPSVPSTLRRSVN